MPTINSLLPPYPTFRDAQGNPLNGGFVYIGQPGLEARTTPKASFFDEALQIPTGTASGAAVRTSAGYPVGHNGSPANVYVDGDYSITVLNSAGVMVFSALYPNFALDTGAAEVGPVLAPDGNLSFPGFAFTSDQDTGFSRPGSGQIQTVANGVLVSTSTETGTSFAQPVTAGAITASGQVSAGSFAGAGVQSAVAASLGQVPSGTAVINYLAATAGWAPYNGTDGVLYDFAVTGAVAQVEATFSNGYEYLLICDAISGTAVASPALRVFRNSTGAYTAKSNLRSGTASAASFYYIELEFYRPRLAKRAHVARSFSYAQIDATIADTFDALAASTTIVGITHATATVLDKVEISMSTGNLDAGRILLYRRPSA
jgi:hypothetical protein